MALGKDQKTGWAMAVAGALLWFILLVAAGTYPDHRAEVLVLSPLSILRFIFLVDRAKGLSVSTFNVTLGARLVLVG